MDLGSDLDKVEIYVIVIIGFMIGLAIAVLGTPCGIWEENREATFQGCSFGMRLLSVAITLGTPLLMVFGYSKLKIRLVDSTEYTGSTEQNAMEPTQTNGYLSCPECNEVASFNAQIEGNQEGVHFQEGDGERVVANTGAITAVSVDEESLVCDACGNEVALDDLVPASE